MIFYLCGDYTQAVQKKIIRFEDDKPDWKIMFYKLLEERYKKDLPTTYKVIALWLEDISNILRKARRNI